MKISIGRSSGTHIVWSSSTCVVYVLLDLPLIYIFIMFIKQTCYSFLLYTLGVYSLLILVAKALKHI